MSSNYACYTGCPKLDIINESFYTNTLTIPTALPTFAFNYFRVKGFFDTAIAYYALFKFDDDFLTYDSDQLYTEEYLNTLPYGDLKQIALDLNITLTGEETYPELIALILAEDVRKGWKKLVLAEVENWLPLTVIDEKTLEFDSEVLPLKALIEYDALREGSRKDFSIYLLATEIIGNPNSSDLPYTLFGYLDMEIE